MGKEVSKNQGNLRGSQGGRRASGEGRRNGGSGSGVVTVDGGVCLGTKIVFFFFAKKTVFFFFAFLIQTDWVQHFILHLTLRYIKWVWHLTTQH